MKTYSVFVIKILIVSIILGRALTDPHLYEFCSKQFFDRITTHKEVGDRTVIEFYRQNEAKKGSIHKWKAFLDDKITYDYFNISPLSYELMGTIVGQLPDLQLDQPKQCPINFEAKEKSWDLWFKLENLPNGPIIRYRKGIIRKEKWHSSIASWKVHYDDNQTTSISKAENVFMTSLLCKPSKQIIYGIGEDMSQMDGNKRSQFVGIIEVKSKGVRAVTEDPWLTLVFDIISTFNRVTSLKDFLAIDCPEPMTQSVTQNPIPTTIPKSPISTTTPVEEEEEVESITYLLIIFGVLLILGIILIIVDLNVYQMRKRNNSDSDRTKESAISKTTLDFEGDMHREQ